MTLFKVWRFLLGVPYPNQVAIHNIWQKQMIDIHEDPRCIKRRLQECHLWKINPDFPRMFRGELSFIHVFQSAHCQLILNMADMTCGEWNKLYKVRGAYLWNNHVLRKPYSFGTNSGVCLFSRNRLHLMQSNAVEDSSR